MTTGTIDKGEWKAVLVLWVLLLGLAIAALLVLQRNAHRIVYHLEYVAVNRYQKAMALYTEAEKRTLAALKKRQDTNVNSATAVAVAATDVDVKAARELFAKALAVDPRPSFIPEQERHYKMLGDLLGAAGQTQEQQLAYARAAISRRDYSAAKSLLDRAEDATSSPAVVLARAQLEWECGRKPAVQMELDKVLEDKWPTEAHVLHGRLLQESGKLPEAVVAFKKALKDTASPGDVRKLLAGVYSQLNQPAEAIQILEEGREQGGESDGNYMHILGDLLHAGGRKKESIQALEKAARLEPNSGSVQLSLARAYQDDGAERKASRALQRATALDPALQGELLK